MRRHQGLVNIANFTIDVGLILVAYGLATWLRNGYMGGAPTSFFSLFDRQYVVVACVYAVCIGLAYVFCRLYGSFRFRNFFQEAGTIAVINGVGILGVGAVLYIARLTDFSRMVLGFFYVFSVGLVLAKRLVFRSILRHSRSLGYARRNLLVVGDGEFAERYIRYVKENVRYGYQLVGYVSAQAHPEYGEARLGGYDDFSALLSGQRVDQVVFALSGTDMDRLGGMIAACGRYGAKASVIPQYNDFIPATPTVEAAGNLKLLNVRSTPDKGPIWAFVKRAMDLTGAMVGLVLASPIMLVTAIAPRDLCPGAGGEKRRSFQNVQVPQHVHERGRASGRAAEIQSGGRTGLQDGERPPRYAGGKLHPQDQHRRAAAAVERAERGNEHRGAAAADPPGSGPVHRLGLGPSGGEAGPHLLLAGERAQRCGL